MKKILLALIASISFPFFGLVNASAATKDIELIKVDVADKSSTITVEEPAFLNNEITSNITFNNVDDYVNFKLTLKNNEGAGLKITNVNDNLENENIEVSYTYDDNTFIQPGETTTVYANMSYETRLINEDKTINNFRINLTLEQEEKQEDEEDGDDIVVPDTGSNTIITNQGKDNNVIYYIIASIVSAIGLTVIMLVKNKKIRLAVLAGVLATLGLVTVPIATQAEEKDEAFINYTNIVIKGEFEEYTVAFDTDGGTDIDSQTVKYGEKATKPDTDPEKTDHIFEGWYTDNTYGTEFDFDTAITSDTTIYAAYHHKCRTFSTDSWDTIVNNINSDSNYYAIGCEKEVEMDMDDDNTPESYTVRLSNTSTPEVCNTPGYSQTACGTVIEFVDMPAYTYMNPTRTNEGGYKESAGVLWLNDYFYNKLSNEVKSVIIPTYPIVSGSGSGGVSDNITAEDTDKNKIYYLSTREIGSNSNTDNKNNELTDTRTLDYYVINNTAAKRKKYDSSGKAHWWWLRSAVSNKSESFFDCHSIGGPMSNYSDDDKTGVAPAFRIGINN